VGKPNRTHTPAFKAQVALAAIKGDRTISEVAAHYESLPFRMEESFAVLKYPDSPRSSLDNLRSSAPHSLGCVAGVDYQFAALDDEAVVVGGVIGRDQHAVLRREVLR
jgi:transposase